MYNNASYRQFTVSGTTSFTFSPVGPTVRMNPAINAWIGATINNIEPAPGVDGRALIAYKVTNPSAGVWHYEYALSNQNLDRSIQSFSVPLGCGITVSNLGFHAPLNHPGIANDGTSGSLGYSNAPWTTNQTASALSLEFGDLCCRTRTRTPFAGGPCIISDSIPIGRRRRRTRRSVFSRPARRSPSPFKAPRHAIRCNS